MHMGHRRAGRLGQPQVGRFDVDLHQLHAAGHDGGHQAKGLASMNIQRNIVDRANFAAEFSAKQRFAMGENFC